MNDQYLEQNGSLLLNKHRRVNSENYTVFYEPQNVEQNEVSQTTAMFLLPLSKQGYLLLVNDLFPFLTAV